MADQNLQRFISQLRDALRDLRTGEGEGRAAAIGRSAKRMARQLRTGVARVKKTFGFSYVDTFNEDIDEQRRRRKAREFMGDDDPEFASVRGAVPHSMLNVAPEYRGQVASGVAAANTLTTGTTLVDGKRAEGDAGTGGAKDEW